MREQSSLGGFQNGGRADFDNTGKMSLAKVVKVYNDHSTCDVVLITSNFIGDNDDTNGRITCVQLENFSGWDDDLETAYGNITALHVGQLVVIAYLDSMKERAVVIGSLPPHINEFTNTPRYRAENGKYPKERFEHIFVSRLQDYSYLNAEGEFEKVSSSRAFFVGRKEKMSDRRENAFNYDDLSLKHNIFKRVIGVVKEKLKNWKPFNFILVTKNQFEDAGATFNRWYHDAELGVTRFSKDNEKQVFYIELDEENNFEIRFHQDSNKRKGPAMPNPEQTLRISDNDIHRRTNPNGAGPDPQKITRIKYKKDGTLMITKVNGAIQSEIKLSDSGIDMKSTEPVNIGSSSVINLTAPVVNVASIQNTPISPDFSGAADPPQIEL